MAKPKKLKRRIFGSWLTSMVSISLVLILLGFFLLLVVNAGKLTKHVREKIGFTLVLQNDLKEVEIIQLQKLVSALEFVKSTRYIDKETAAKELTEELGEDFTGFLGYNPLFSSIDVKLYAPFTQPDSLLVIEKELLEFPQVQEVYFQKDLASLINKNIKKISLVLLIISSIMAFIVVALINNSIRISIYSQRFTINTMQMVGATNRFIRKPFVKQSILWGIYGAVVANLVILSGIYSLRNELEGIIGFSDVASLGIVLALVFLLGLIISYVSTFFAVNKFLKMKFDELF